MVDYVRALLSDVDVFSTANPEYGCLRSDVEETFRVIESSEARNQHSVAKHGDNLSGSFPERRNLFLERLCLLLVEHTLVSALVYLSVEQRRVNLLVPNEHRVYHRVNFLSALEAFRIGIDRLELNSGRRTFPSEQIEEDGPVHRSVSVECDHLILLPCLFDDRGGKLLRHVRGASADY